MPPSKTQTMRIPCGVLARPSALNHDRRRTRPSTQRNERRLATTNRPAPFRRTGTKTASNPLLPSPEWNRQRLLSHLPPSHPSHRAFRCQPRAHLRRRLMSRSWRSRRRIPGHTAALERRKQSNPPGGRKPRSGESSAPCLTAKGRRSAGLNGQAVRQCAFGVCASRAGWRWRCGVRFVEVFGPPSE